MSTNNGQCPLHLVGKAQAAVGLHSSSDVSTVAVTDKTVSRSLCSGLFVFRRIDRPGVRQASFADDYQQLRSVCESRCLGVLFPIEIRWIDRGLSLRNGATVLQARQIAPDSSPLQSVPTLHLLISS